VPYGKLIDPQSLNLYSYVENNPLRSPDPDGHVGINHEFDALSCIDPQHDAACTSVSHHQTLVQIALRIMHQVGVCCEILQCILGKAMGPTAGWKRHSSGYGSCGICDKLRYGQG